MAEGGGQSIDLSAVEVRQTGDDSLWVQLPEVVARNEVMALEVSTTLFGHGVSFTGRVGNRENSGAWQRVEAGDVLEEVESQVLRVLAPEGRIGLSGLQLTSQVVTPNGDGVNEAATLHFEVLRMDGAQSVLVSVYDLSGRQVWDVGGGARPSKRSVRDSMAGHGSRGRTRAAGGVFVARGSGRRRGCGCEGCFGSCGVRSLLISASTRDAKLQEPYIATCGSSCFYYSASICGLSYE